MSAFALDNGIVYHTYARRTDVLWGMYQWLRRAPLGRNENASWCQHTTNTTRTSSGRAARAPDGRRIMSRT